MCTETPKLEAPIPSGYHQHGFSKPLSVQQYQTWVLVFVQFLCFYLFVLPMLGVPQRYIYAGIHVGVTILGFIFFFSVSFTDPVHPHVTLARENAHKERIAASEGHFPRFEIPGPQKGEFRKCGFCDINRALTTKHCSICSKCIISFDHHCLFLNTCIGGHNYRRFFTLVTLTTGVTIFQIWAAIFLFININDPEVVTRINSSIFQTKLGYYIPLGISLVPPLVSLGAFGTLLIFHLYISIRGISTYAWILERRQIKADRQEKKHDEEMKGRQADLDQKRKEIYQDWLREKSERMKKHGVHGVAGKKPIANSNGIELSQPGSELTHGSNAALVGPAKSASHVFETVPDEVKHFPGVSEDPINSPQEDDEEDPFRPSSHSSSKDDDFVRKISFVLGVDLNSVPSQPRLGSTHPKGGHPPDPSSPESSDSRRRSISIKGSAIQSDTLSRV